MIYDVYSFDFDGCLANLAFLKLKHKEINDIIAANSKLFDIIKTSPNKKIVLINSNRQAPRDDLANSAADERGSCYQATKAVAAYLNAEFDGFLLADLYNDLRPGKALKQALKYLAKNNKDYTDEVGKEKVFFSLYNWIHDTSKLTTVYAQMHELALRHTSDDTFNFYFADDREDLLDELHSYFSKYPQLIPRNIKLCFRHYAGPIDRDDNEIIPLFRDYEPIQGTREEPDANYRQTVKNMAAVTIEQMTEKGIDITANCGKKAAIVTTYSDAQKCHFDMAAINCAQYYVPGTIPKHPPEILPAKKEKKLVGKNTYKYDKLETKDKMTYPQAASSSSTPRQQILSRLSVPNITPPLPWTSASKSQLTLKSTLPLKPTSSPALILSQTPPIPTHTQSSTETLPTPNIVQTPTVAQVPTLESNSSEQQSKFVFFRKKPGDERKIDGALGHHKNRKDIADASSSYSEESRVSVADLQKESIGVEQSSTDEENTNGTSHSC